MNQANTGVHGFNDGDSIGNAAVIQSLGGGAGTGKSQVQGLSPRRMGSSSDLAGRVVLQVSVITVAREHQQAKGATKRPKAIKYLAGQAGIT